MRYMLARFVCVFAAALLVSFGPSRADTIISNLDEPVGGSGGVFASGPPQEYAQEFTTGNFGFALSSIVASVGGAVGSFTASAELVADNGGMPGSTVLTTFTVPPIGTTFSNETFTPNASVVLGANTNYWFILSATGTGDTTQYRWQYTNTNSSSLPHYASSQNNGATWSVFTSGPFLIAVNSVPEPSSLVLIALGVPAIAIAMLRRRTAGVVQEGPVRSPR